MIANGPSVPAWALAMNGITRIVTWGAATAVSTKMPELAGHDLATADLAAQHSLIEDGDQAWRVRPGEDRLPGHPDLIGVEEFLHLR